MKLSFKRNVGPIDSVARFMAALTLFGLTYLKIINVGTFAATALYTIAGLLLLEAVTAY